MATVPEAGEQPEREGGVAERVRSLELQVSDLNHQLDNLTNQFVRLRLQFESARASHSDSLSTPVPSAERAAPAVRMQSRVPPPPPAPALEIAPQRSARSLEVRLGSQVFNAVGIFALIVGASWALKLAIEHGLIGPVARILIGLGIGSGLVLWSERFRRKGFAPFSYSLKAVGSAVLYLCLWAAFQLYHLLPGGVAFLAMIVVTFWNAFMAWSQSAELLALYALIGGLLTPVLLSTGGDHETFLFSYVAAIDAATILLVRMKPWKRLLIPAFLASVFYFIGYYTEYFHRGPKYGYEALPTGVWNAQSTETALFALVFGSLFAVVSLGSWSWGSEDPAAEKASSGPASTPRSASSTLLAVLLPLANAGFLGLALYSVFEDSGLHASLAWLAVALAALYLGVMRLQANSPSRAVHLAIGVVFLTIALPLKASGHTLTTAWLMEGLVLFWISTRFAAVPSEEDARPARILRGLSAAGYALGLVSLAAHWTFFNSTRFTSFFNRDLGAALVAAAALLGAVSVARQSVDEHGDTRRAAIYPWLLALSSLDLVGLLLVASEFDSSWANPAASAFVNIGFANATVGLALLAIALWTTGRLARSDRRGRDSLLRLAGGTLVLFNLAAICSIEHEIDSLFHTGEANLQRSLAVSAFLMLYGAVLLALGFWRRIAFVRWQALILLTFTIAKVFLYDTSSLSQGYRVTSFLGLGVLLMAVSFAYQKDWLNLKTPESAGEASSDAATAASRIEPIENTTQ